MLSKPLIITSGIASEYVLHKLSNYLRELDFEVFELDFENFKGDTVSCLKQFRQRDTIYITSAHTNFTKYVQKYIAPSYPLQYPNYLAPIEIIPLLEPKLSIYIPHDLLTPYGEENLSEIRYLDLYDHILVPTLEDKNILQSILPSSTKIHYAGWIKYQVKDKIKKPKTIPKLLFISLITHLLLKYGQSGVVNYLYPLLCESTYIKFPAWRDIDLLEAEIKAKTPAQVIPCEEDSIQLIKQAEVIICNSASSIHAETTMLGKSIICILDNEGISPNDQIQKLKHLKNIYFHDYTTKKPIPEELFNNAQDCKGEITLKPFDFNIVKMIIENC